MRKFVAIAALSAAFLAFGPSLFAQATNGSITGTVTDATGAVINAATITIKNVDTGVTRSLTTRSEEHTSELQSH